ncbi:MAG: hypothetical protein IPM51_10610 [Sphingobacteriaceae bacterium]|nr:hypothetical protein [Sphingobacteriaceae bacterium]
MRFKTSFLINSSKLPILVALTFVLLAFSIIKCDLKLVGATSERWNSGINGGGSGTEYYFNIKINTAKNLQFDSVWVNGKCLPTYISNTSLSVSQNPVNFKKNETITLRASDLSLNNTISISKPVKYKGDALIRYYLDDKTKYLIIKKITPKESINRP